jgi:hypothetical protein
VDALRQAVVEYLSKDLVSRLAEFSERTHLKDKSDGFVLLIELVNLIPRPVRQFRRQTGWQVAVKTRGGLGEIVPEQASSPPVSHDLHRLDQFTKIKA